MTAEIAILNKTAIALAADSAVTLSAGSKEEKIFDSADKLFELSNESPIGVMIYNDIGFMETPISLLISDFRRQTIRFPNVAAAALAFLSHLKAFGAESPTKIKEDGLRSVLDPFMQMINDRFEKKRQDFILSEWPENFTPADVRAKFVEIFDEILDVFERVLSRQEDALFLGQQGVVFDELAENTIHRLVAQHFHEATESQKQKLTAVSRLVLSKKSLSDSFTGIVVAGFGSDELFPTLLSFEVEGIVSDTLKYNLTNYVDIDRTGPRAKVIPFAQKEMVERFLYGLDAKIQNDISGFCEETVSQIRTEIFEKLDIAEDADRISLGESAMKAEAAFMDGLRQKAFGEIRSKSEAEIEGMVEFMPKPELAKMAEALVNLTSIKRRVSRGMETVAGPIDVAVISQSDGFVWVKRKHYFPADLNLRYAHRVRAQMSVKEGSFDEPHEVSRSATRKRRSPAKRRGNPAAKIPPATGS